MSAWAAHCLVHAHSCYKYLRPSRGASQQHVECSPHPSSPASLARQMHPDTFAVLSRTFVAQGLLEHCTIILSRYQTYSTFSLERCGTDTAYAARPELSVYSKSTTRMLAPMWQRDEPSSSGKD